MGICSHNEENNIGRLLQNVLSQRLLASQSLLEVIVVSSGSTDRTNAIVKEYERRDSRVRLIAEPARNGKSRAQNLILKNAVGEVLVLLSADVMPAPWSLSRLVSKIKSRIGGADARAVLVNPLKTVTDFVSHLTWEIHNETLLNLSNDGLLRHFAGDMFAIRAGIIEAIPENIVNDDAYIALALTSKGWKVIHDPTSVVYILGPRNTSDYITQRERVLFGHRQIAKTIGEYPTTFEALAIKAPARAAKILARVLSKIPPRQWWKCPIAGALEAASIARSLINLDRDYTHWRRVDSTKGVVGNLLPFGSSDLKGLARG